MIGGTIESIAYNRFLFRKGFTFLGRGERIVLGNVERNVAELRLLSNGPVRVDLVDSVLESNRHGVFADVEQPACHERRFG